MRQRQKEVLRLVRLSLISHSNSRMIWRLTWISSVRNNRTSMTLSLTTWMMPKRAIMPKQVTCT